jgi:hypothetical protein
MNPDKIQSFLCFEKIKEEGAEIAERNYAVVR